MKSVHLQWKKIQSKEGIFQSMASNNMYWSTVCIDSLKEKIISQMICTNFTDYKFYVCLIDVINQILF